MLNRVLLSSLSFALLLGCGNQDYQYSDSEHIGSKEQAVGEPTQSPEWDSDALVRGLDRAVYKDIAVTSTNLYALTTTGIKSVTHANIGSLASAGYIKTTQLDAIDFTTGNYGLVGARSKGSNPNAVFVLNAASASPTTINLPTSINTIVALETRVISNSVIRAYFKVPNSTVGTTIYEYEYNGSSLTLKSQTGTGLYVPTGFTIVGTNTYLIGWFNYIPNYAVKFYTDGSPSITEAQPYLRDYPGGTTTAFLTHGFVDSASSLRGISPIQLEYGKYQGSVDSLFALTSDSTSGQVAIVRTDLSKIHFNKTPTYTPDFWNNLYQSSNNCYNYSTNRRTDTFAQPGQASGHPMSWPPSSTSVVSNAAVSDGLEYLGNPATMPVPPEGKTLIASIVGLHVGNPDYHWYRKDRNTQYWTHKPGSGAATNKDQNGATITDPRTAAWNRAMYDTFVGFFLADSNWFEGMGVENIQ